MLIIKRYPNRKLYDTEQKQYITLDRIAEMIREGLEIQVIDHATGEDLTALTLTQIIFEQEKRKSGFLPRNVLNSLVRTGGDTVSGIQRALATSLGWMAQIDEEIKRRIDDLVRHGELSADEAGTLHRKFLKFSPLQKSEKLPGEQDLQAILDSRGVPSKAQLQELAHQLDELARKIDDLSSPQAKS